MKISLNGNEHLLEKPCNILELLESIGLGGKPAVVELNKKALFPREYSKTIIAENDQLEIITVAAGG